MDDRTHSCLKGGAHGDEWKDQVERPLITLVTATFNAVRELPYTISSIRTQDYSRMEWIVVDGASSDGTVDLLRGNEDVIDCWMSEPDLGVYDAWNKACAMARGEWLIFLGAGDEIKSPSTMTLMSRHLESAFPSHDLVYGKLQYLSASARTPLEDVGKPWENMDGKWELMRPALPPHGAVFHHRSLFDSEAPFDLRFRIAADAHFMLRHILQKPPLFVPEVVSRATIGGLSFRLSSATSVAADIKAINLVLGIRPPLSHMLLEQILLLAKYMLNLILPSTAAFWMADLYRVLLRKPKRWTVK